MKTLTLDELYQIKEAYRHFSSLNDFIRVIDELIAALEQAQQQKTEDSEIKARLCKESNSLHDRLKIAERRIAELENDEVHQRLANAEHQLYMAELAKNNLRTSRRAQFHRRRATEKRIAELESQNLTTSNALLDAGKRVAELEAREFVVTLPKEFDYEHDDLVAIIPVMEALKVRKAIRAAGGTVKEGG